MEYVRDLPTEYIKRQNILFAFQSTNHFSVLKTITKCVKITVKTKK